MVEQQADDQHPAPADLRGVHRQRHGQAAGEQDGGVDGAEADVELVAGVGERRRVQRAVDDVGGEQAAEEHDLGDQEHPHAERRRLVLLLGVVELMGDVRRRSCSGNVRLLAASSARTRRAPR